MKPKPVISAESVPDQTIERIIPAGESRQIQGLADRFYVVESNGPVRIKTGVIPEKVYSKGRGKRLPAPAYFDGAEIHNDNDYDIKVEIEWSFGEEIDNRLNVIAGSGAALATFDNDGHIEVEDTLAAGNLAHNASIEFDPEPPEGYLKRRYVSISNNSATARLLLLDANDDEIGAVYPSQTNEFYHQDTFKLRNESGSAVDVKAYTCWEVDPYIID